MWSLLYGVDLLELPLHLLLEPGPAASVKTPLPLSRARICFKQPESVSLVCTLVGLKLEVGRKFMDAVSYESSPGRLGLTVTEVIVLLPRLLLNLAIRLLTSVTHSRLASGTVYDGYGIGFLGRLLQVVAQSSILYTVLLSSICVFSLSQLLNFFGL